MGVTSLAAMQVVLVEGYISRVSPSQQFDRLTSTAAVEGIEEEVFTGRISRLSKYL